jgi:hypothetical protein
MLSDVLAVLVDLLDEFFPFGRLVLADVLHLLGENFITRREPLVVFEDGFDIFEREFIALGCHFIFEDVSECFAASWSIAGSPVAGSLVKIFELTLDFLPFPFLVVIVSPGVSLRPPTIDGERLNQCCLF